MVILNESDKSESIEEMLINDTWNFNIMLANYFLENPDLIELWDVVPSDLKIIIRRCLSLNPVDRPKIQDLLLNKKFDNNILERKYDNKIKDYQPQTQKSDIEKKHNNKIDEEQKIKEQERLYIIHKEQQEYKKQRECEEEKKLCKIVNIFNSKDIKPIITGFVFENSFLKCSKSEPQKFHINLSMVKKIKNDNVLNLYKYYKNISEDYDWLIKYAFGKGEEKPYVNFIFDYYIDNIDTLIKDAKKDLDVELKNPSPDYKSHQPKKSFILSRNLDTLKKLKNNVKNTKEYYYVNNSPDLPYPGTKDPNNNYGRSSNELSLSNNFVKEWMKHIEHKIHTFMKTFLDLYDIDDTSPFNIFKNIDNVYISNKKIQIKNPLNKSIIQIDLIEGHKNFIMYNVQTGFIQRGDWVRYKRTYVKKDLEGLLSIAIVILELIEFLHPDINSLDENKAI